MTGINSERDERISERSRNPWLRFLMYSVRTFSAYRLGRRLSTLRSSTLAIQYTDKRVAGDIALCAHVCRCVYLYVLTSYYKA
jgi:hypothetical protein